MSTTLYPGIPFSPQAQLTNNTGAADSIIEVSDATAFPPAPNLATIGTDEDGETILYAAKTDTALSGCIRGVEGVAKAWQRGDPIARNWTAKDHADLIAAVRETATAAQDAQTAVTVHNGSSAAHGERFTAKQDKLTGRPGQVVGFGADGAAVAAPGWSNPNLLLNWDFRSPVNRNGKSEYIRQPNYGYGIDRWFFGSDDHSESVVVAVESEYRHILITNKTASTSYFTQYTNFPVLNRDYTFSVLTGDNELVVTTNLPNNSKLVSTDWGGVVFGRNSSFRGSLFSQIRVNPDTSVAVVAAKLELGSIQTLAHRDAEGNWVLNDPSDYDLQYALCSQYSPLTGYWVGNQHSNPNLLDNWYFGDPVNQRGQAAYTAGYSIDRWFVNTGVELKIESGCISVSVNSGIENPTIFSPCSLSEIPKGEMVFSVIGSGVAYSMQFENNGSATPRILNVLSTDFGSIRAQVLAGNKLLFVLFVTPGTTCFFQAVKLELGPIQTLARQDEAGNWVLNDPPPNKALELLKCQRYQYKNTNGATEFIRAARITPNTIYFDLPIPTPMRATPTIVNPGSLSVYSVAQNAGSDTAVPGFTFAASLLGGATLRIQASKTAHGLSDAALFATSTLFDASL